MAGKSPLEMAAQSLVEISAMQRDSIEQMAASQKAGFAKIDAILGTLAEQQSQLTASVNKLSDRIETRSQVTNSNQIIVNNLVALAASQQATVDKLLLTKAG